MRVVHIIEGLGSGGKERQLVELLKGHSKLPWLGCELIIMSKDIHYNYIDNLDIPVHILTRKTRKDPSVFFRLFRLLRDRKYDIIHSWGSMCSIYSLPAVLILKIKFVNGFLRDAPPKISFNDRLWIASKLTFPISDAIVANSKAGLKAYNAPSKKSHYIYNGFDLNRSENLPDPDFVKKKYHVNTEFVVGMVASFSERKDYSTFLTAAKIVLSNRNDVTFLAIGDGINLESCMKSVPEKHKDRIIFTGKIRDVESLVQVMNIGVLASVHGEGISNSIMEYMSLGKPVVASDCGGNEELVVDGETGYLIQLGDFKELADRLISLLDNARQAEKMGRMGNECLKALFSLERMTQDFATLYQNLL